MSQSRVGKRQNAENGNNAEQIFHVEYPVMMSGLAAEADSQKRNSSDYDLIGQLSMSSIFIGRAHVLPDMGINAEEQEAYRYSAPC